MSATDSKEDLTSKTNDKDSNSGPERSQIASSAEPVLDGSGDHQPSSKKTTSDFQKPTSSPNEEQGTNSGPDCSVTASAEPALDSDNHLPSYKETSSELQEPMNSPNEEQGTNSDPDCSVTASAEPALDSSGDHKPSSKVMTSDIQKPTDSLNKKQGTNCGPDRSVKASAEPAVDGSGTSSDRQEPMNSRNEEIGKNIGETANILEKTEGIATGDENIALVNMSPKVINISEVPSPSPAEATKEPSEESKPGSIIEDVDSETQDDELVLKWDDDDDDEDPIILDVGRIDEKVHEESVKETTDDIEKVLLDEIDAQIADLDKNSQENEKEADITEIDLCKSDDEDEEVIISTNSVKNEDSINRDAQGKVNEKNNINLDNVDTSYSNATDSKTDTNSEKEKAEQELESVLLKDPPEENQASQKDTVDEKHANITEIDLCKSDDEDEKQDCGLVADMQEVITSNNSDKNEDYKSQDDVVKVDEKGNVNLDIVDSSNSNVLDSKIYTSSDKEKTVEELEADLLKDPPDTFQKDAVDFEDDSISESIEDSNDLIKLLSPKADSKDTNDAPRNVTDDEDILLGAADNNSQTKEVEEKEGNDAVGKEDNEAMDVDTSNLEDNAIVDQTIEKNIPKVSTQSIQDNNESEMEVDDTKLDTTQGEELQGHESSTIIEPREHGLNETNAMIEIPTQELINLSNLSDSSETEHVNETTELVHEEKSKEEDTDAEKTASLVATAETDEINVSPNQEDELNTAIKAIIEPTGTTEEEILEDKITEQVFQQKIRVKSLSSMIDGPMQLFEGNESAEKEIVAEEGINVDGTSVEAIDVPKDVSVPSKDGSFVIDDAQPSTSKVIMPYVEYTRSDEPNTAKAEAQIKEQPEMAPDSSDVGEVTDSLGLLAESSRVRDDDEEQETSEHDEDDDDYDPDDESSNQMAAEQSEDSAQHSEVDMPKTHPDIESAQDSNNAQDVPVTHDSVTPQVTTISHDSDNKIVTVNQDSNETEATSPVPKPNTEENNTTQGLEDVQIKDITQDSNLNQDSDAQIESNEMSFEIGNAANDEKEIEGEIEIDDDIVCEEVEVTTENIEDLDQVSEEVAVVDIDLPETGLVEVPQATEKPMEVDTVKISDNSDDEAPSRIRRDSSSKATKESPSKPAKPDADTQQSPSKMKKLEISKPRHVLNIVDLEESSSEDDIQVVQKPSPDKKGAGEEVPNQIEVTSSGNASDADAVPKSTPVTTVTPKSSSTSEVLTKTAAPTKPGLFLTDTKTTEGEKDGGKPACNQEVFNLDSDEDESTPANDETPPEKDKPPSKCVNNSCTSNSSEPFYKADSSTVAYYDCNRKKKAMVCRPCAYTVAMRAQRLVEGIKNLTPLLELEMGRASQELVEISDSESEEEVEPDDEKVEGIGEEKARKLERQLAAMINNTWMKYNMDARLKETQDELALDLVKLEKESAEVNQMLDECQLATDKLRCELYATFEVQRQELQPINIVDTPDASYSVLEPFPNTNEAKRRLSSASESAPKRPAIPLGYSPLDDKTDAQTKTQDPKSASPESSKLDDDKDVSVVRLSAEAAPASLPPPGELQRPPVHPGMPVYAMKNAFGSWLKARVVECTPKGNGQAFTMCRVRFENKAARSLYKLLPARCLAYSEPASVRMTIGTRVIALFKDTTAEKMMKRESFYSGIVAEVPNPVNKYRYLVFFDDGYAQYVQHADTRLVCEFSSLVWEEVHPFSREFVKEYLLAYPERPMVRLHTGQSLKTEWNGKWWVSKVTQVDASLVQVYFEQDKRTEWIYRGSTRLAPLYLELQAAEKHRARPMPRNRMQARVNMPYVEYTRSDEPDAAKAEAQIKAQQEEIRRQRAVAKKSTAAVQPPPAANLDGLTSRVVYYTPKNAVRPHKMVTHTCSPACKRTDVLALNELRTYNPLAKPLLSAWERQIVRYKGHKEVMYRAPCGRRVRNMRELHRYLRTIESDMGVDLFDFGPNTHCLAEFVLNKCIVGKKDLSHGKENVPVPCVNYYDDSLPEFCSYNTERTPTAGVPLNLDPEFLCGCDCTDDCEDKSKCACWKMTLEGARTIGLKGPNIGYSYKRLPQPLPSGIYECNSRCKCKSTCLNRVAQHPLQLKLQVFKTVNRGWGIRALNDVPKGAFLCIYAGNLLTDATANLDGLNEGDEYLAELDYIEVVEQMKEGFEEDIPEQDKKLDKKELGKKSESESEENTEEEDNVPSKDEIHDDDFRPVGYVNSGPTAFSKRLRKRDKVKKEKEEPQKKDGNNGEEDCITISDDEELREPSSFAAQAGMGAEFVSKYKSVRAHFGKDEACYIMDAKVQGNIGRYLNHSCSPNVFVQNVFVDTHDPRFPWVAFFALSHIRAGTELTWNYNYDVGSVPGKALYCYCGAVNCRGRLL